MTGRDYATQAWERAKEVLSQMRSREDLSVPAAAMEALEKSCLDLEQNRNKAVLRTRAGTNLAISVYEAVRQLEASWEEAQREGGAEAMRDAMETFCFAVDALVSALRGRTVIMT